MAVLALVFSLSLTVVGAAHADTVASLTQLTGFHQMVVDSAGGYVFVSEGISSGGLSASGDASSALVITDLAGKYVTTLDSGDGVEGIALSADGTHLFAALSAAGEVASIDVATIKNAQPAQALYAIPASDVAYSVAEQSGKLWVGFREKTVPSGGIGYFDLSDASPVFTPIPATDWYSAPDLAVSPDDSGLLVAANPDEDPTTAFAYDTGTGTVEGTPGHLGLGAGTAACGHEYQLAVLPGSRQFIVACHGQGDYIFGATNLTAPTGSVGSGNAYTNAVAVAADGTVAAAGAATASGFPAADVTSPSGTLVNVLPLGAYLGSDANFLPPGGLALAPDASKLFAVLVGANGVDILQALDEPSVTRPVLSLSAPVQALRGSTAALSGTLALTTGAVLPAGAVVTITRTAPDGTVGTPETVPVATDGIFSASEDTQALGTSIYTVRYSGDPSATIAAGSATATTDVYVDGTGFTLTGPSPVAPGKPFTLTGTLTFYQGTQSAVPITVSRKNPNGTTTTLRAVTTSSAGSFSVPDTLSTLGSYTYTATYAGSETSATATKTLKVIVAKPLPALTLRTGASTALYNSTITVTAHLGTTYSNRVVTIKASFPGSQTVRVLKTATVNSTGNLTISFPNAVRNVIFTATFSGDARYGATSASASVGIAARVSMSESGWSYTTTASGYTFRVFHHYDILSTAIGVTPNKHGETVQIQFQDWSGGKWVPDPYNLFDLTLTTSSTASKNFGFDYAAGSTWRIRAVFLPSATDKTNVSYYSGWFYLKVVS